MMLIGMKKIVKVSQIFENCQNVLDPIVGFL